MNRIFVLSLVLLAFCLPFRQPVAHSWFSDYSTGREEFESCCGGQDCHTAESLGYPDIESRGDGGYRVKLGKYWVQYDFPAVHTSHDTNTWVCYIGEAFDDPEPLCLFLPAGIM